MALNENLKAIVTELYQQFCDDFIQEGHDVGSAEFLSSFAYNFLPRENTDLCQKIYSAAVTGHSAAVDRAIEAFFSNWSGGDPQGYTCLAIEDFLNYVIPRTIGLADAKEHFNKLYDRFDSDFFGDECAVTTFAILSNVWDNSGRVVLPDGFRLRYVTKSFVKTASPIIRDSEVSYSEINRRAHPIGLGRPINDKHSYFILEHTQRLPKTKELISTASRMGYDVARKFTFAIRLLKFSGCFSDYRGFRMVAHLSALHLSVMNFPDSQLDNSDSRELNDPDHIWLMRLWPKLVDTDYARIFILDQKIEDAIRREREATFDQEMTRRRVAVDQLLDYIQILEAVLNVKGSENFSLYAAVLLKASGNGQFAHGTYEVYEFLKNIFNIRNNVVHGRLDEVLHPKGDKFKLDILRFRQMVHVLASLFVLNGPLRDAATKLTLGGHVDLQSIYKVAPEEAREMWKRKPAFDGW
jgi:hypothetical protein